jgi:APA family basic amino acid/polyamine antiporter
VTLVVGNAVGAGLYTTSGFSLGDLGSRTWVMLAWLVGGVVALAGAASYGMLARRLGESGGEYLYLSRLMHPAAGFVAGWISLLAGFTGAIAFAATALDAYLRAGFPALQGLHPDSLAIAAILFAGAVHSFRAESGAAVHDAIVAVMIAALVALAVGGLGGLAGGAWTPTPAGSFDAPFDALSFAQSLVWISLSYSGFNAAVYVAGEAREVGRDVPRAMVMGTTLIIALYLALNALFLYAAEPESIAGQPEVAAIAAEALGGRALRRVIEGVIAVSLLTSVTAMVLVGPRVYAKMAEDGVLPQAFASNGEGPPRKAIALQVALALVVTLAADLRGLLSYLGLTLSLSLALSVSTLFLQQFRRGERPTSRFYPAAPAFFILATVVFAALAALREPVQLLAAGGTVAAGLLAFALHSRSSPSAAT